MKKSYFIIATALLLLSFFAVLLICPDIEDYKASFTSENYDVIAKFDVPKDKDIKVNVAFHLPTTIAIENGDVDSIQLLVSKKIADQPRNYLKSHLEAAFDFSPDFNYGLVDIKMKGHYLMFRGEDWVIARLYEPYKSLFMRPPYIKVLLPRNVEIENNKTNNQNR